MIQTADDLWLELLDAMSSDRVSIHFARTRMVCYKYSITDRTPIFILDECKFSVKEMS
eukprot:IDg13864t1